MPLATGDRKVCQACRTEKDVSEFNSDAARKDGLHHSCRVCQAEYYAANRETILAQQAVYRAKPEAKARMGASNAKYYAASREKIAAQRAEHRAIIARAINAMRACW
jgi:hypothetical protein